MELIPDEDFVTQWLQKSDYDECSVSGMLKNQLNYFTNRRQIDKFHSWLFNCCRPVNSSFGTVYLPQEFKLIYGAVIIKAPPLQTIQTWKLFLQETIVNSPVILELFICFLSHVRVCDDLVPKMILPQEKWCIETTRDVILNVPFTDIQSHDQLTMILRLCYSWGNLILLSYFYAKEKPNLQFSKAAWYDLQPLHDYYDASIWKPIVVEIISTDSSLTEIIFQLLIQKLSILAKAIHIEDDPEVQKLCSKNVLSTVSRILSRIDKEPKLLDSLDLWRFSSFVPDSQMFMLTRAIVKRVVHHEESISYSLTSTIEKGCEKSVFVVSMLNSTIEQFASAFPSEHNFGRLYSYLCEQRFFHDSSEILNDGEKEDLKNYIENTFQEKEAIRIPETTHKAFKILDYLPLEHLQGESQLKCSVLLISLLFSSDFDSDIGELSANYLISILQSQHYFWFFQIYPASDFFSKLFQNICSKDSVHECYGRFINAIIKKYFSDYNDKAEISILKSIYDYVKCAKPRTKLCLSTILLEISMDSDPLLSQLLVKDLLVSLNKSKKEKFTPKEINSTLMVIMEYFSKKSSASNEGNADLLRQFTSLCSKSLSKFSLYDMDSINFKSDVVLLTFLCKKSNRLDTLSIFDEDRPLWSFLFPDYPEINEETDVNIDEFMNQGNISTCLRAIPVISKRVFENLAKKSGDLDGHLNYCLKILKSETLESKKIIAIHALKGLFDRQWTKKDAKDNQLYQFIASSLDELLHSINELILGQSTCDSINAHLISACCDLIQDILRVGRDLLTSPRLYYCLQVCSCLPLQRLIKLPAMYSKVLISGQSIVHQFLLNYNSMATTSMVLIKDLLQNYLITLIQISDHSIFTAYSKTDQSCVVDGSANFNKLISQLTNDFADDFTPFAPHLITCYIHLNHKFNVHPLVKQNLTLCIYRLFNVIKSNQDWKSIYDMIHCRLDESGREFFKILYENYEKFYVFKGRF
uniref:Nucleolar 27S pre-rRNA processing Urb2/Npa2 C-terminal domain-containing protein n=1 Tax=Tetranychus urticae TaxID=32264 RepID=T1KD17_TETUR